MILQWSHQHFSNNISPILDPKSGSKTFHQGVVDTILRTALAIAFSLLKAIKSPLKGLNLNDILRSLNFLQLFELALEAYSTIFYYQGFLTVFCNNFVNFLFHNLKPSSSSPRRRSKKVTRTLCIALFRSQKSHLRSLVAFFLT